MKTTISVLVTLIIVLSGATGAIYYQKMVFDSALQANSEKVTKLQTEVDTKQAELTQAQDELQLLKDQNTTSSLPIVIVGANAIDLPTVGQFSNRVDINFAILEASGYVVIHRNNNGVPGEVVGFSSLLPKGTSENFKIELDQSLAKEMVCPLENCTSTLKYVLAGTEKFFAMLHLDNGDGVYTSLDEDLPAKDSLGNVVMMASEIAEKTY